MLVVLGRRSALQELYPPLIGALVGAASFDPHGVALFGPQEQRHADGWGRLTLHVAPGRAAVSSYHSMEPLYVDRPPRGPPMAGELFAGALNPLIIDLIHARAGSYGMPVNLHSTHPVEAVTRSGARLYLMHNGAVDKAELLRELGIAPESAYARRYNDTYFLAQLLALHIEDELDARALQLASKYVKTALNIAALLLGDGRAELVVGSLYRLLEEPEKRAAYYRLYRAEDEVKGITLFASSTLVDVPDYSGGLPLTWSEVPNGTFERFLIGWEGRVEVRRLRPVMLQALQEASPPEEGHLD
jgi:glutamine amidotransferase